MLAVLKARGAVFAQEIARAAKLPHCDVEEGLAELVARGRGHLRRVRGLRWLMSRRRAAGGPW